ncbi:MAG: hypothetical protein IJW58_03480 [Clostridia bacterium]|nr:hypothetical protein [Clostridia bacterium]
MENFKKKMQRFWQYVWDCYKGSLLTFFMMLPANFFLLGYAFKEGMKQSESMTWCIVAIVVLLAYNALVVWMYGGTNFEMLVSGNMKRMSAMEYGDEYRISSHRYAKEYRPWKGFVMGAFISIFAVVFGILFGANADAINTSFLGSEEVTMEKGTAWLVLLGMLFSGWSLAPFYSLNMAGVTVSYYFSLLVALLPTIVSGVFYIVGAYMKRNKTLRAQELADRAAQAEQNKPKKINYGGLPGTKPRKKK